MSTKSSRPQTIKISLTPSEMKQFRVVKELKPEWNEQQCVDYCRERNFDPTEITSSLQAAFEFDRESQEQWEEVRKKQPASVIAAKAAAEVPQKGGASIRGRSSERGGFAGRGRGRARSAGANRGSREGNPAVEESKSGTDEKSVEEVKPVETKRPFTKRPVKKESKPALVTPVPGKSYSAALLAKLPQQPPVQSTAPVNVAPKSTAPPSQSSPSSDHHSKVESKAEHVETKSEPVHHQVLPTPTPNVSFAAALASGGQAPKWKKKETKKQEAVEEVAPAHPTTTETEEITSKVEEVIIDEPLKEENPLEQEHVQQETQEIAVPASPAASSQLAPPHEEIVSLPVHHKSPSHTPVPKSPAKSPISKVVLSAHPSPSHAPLPPAHTVPAPVTITAPIVVEQPLSELLTTTETVILPSHLQAVSASAPAVQFGSFGKASGPRAPQPAMLPVSVSPAVTVAVAAPAPAATTFAPSTSISSHQTRFPSPASALGILPSAVSTQTDNSKTIGQFPTRVEAATETNTSSTTDYEPSTEEQSAPAPTSSQGYGGDASEHNLYASNFNQLNQAGQAANSPTDAYASQQQSGQYDASSDPYSSMYQGEAQYSMYQGDQSSFYGMRQQNKPDMNKNQPNKNQPANKFNNPAVVGPAQQQQRQPQNKPPRQQQTQQPPFGAQDQYNKGNQRFANQQQQQQQQYGNPAQYGNPNVNQYATKHPQSPSHPQQGYGQPKGAVGSQQQGGYKGGFNKQQNVPMNQQQFGVGGHPYQMPSQPMSYNSVYGYPSAGYMAPQYYPSQYANFAPRGPYGYPYSTFSAYPSMGPSFEADYSQSDYSKQMYSSQPPNNQAVVSQQGGDMQPVGQPSVQQTENGGAGYDPSWQQMKPQQKPSDSQQYPTGYMVQGGPVHQPHHQPSMHAQQPHSHAPVAGPSYQQPMSYQPQHVPGLTHPDQARYQNTQWSQ